MLRVCEQVRKSVSVPHGVFASPWSAKAGKKKGNERRKKKEIRSATTKQNNVLVEWTEGCVHGCVHDKQTWMRVKRLSSRCQCVCVDVAVLGGVDWVEAGAAACLGSVFGPISTTASRSCSFGTRP